MERLGTKQQVEEEAASSCQLFPWGRRAMQLPRGAQVKMPRRKAKGNASFHCFSLSLTYILEISISSSLAY